MEVAGAWRSSCRRRYVCLSCITRKSLESRTARRTFHASPLRRQGVLETLESRGLIHQIAGNRATLSSLLANERLSIYAGIDPTAPSLHLGHLLPLMVLFWLHNHGHNVVSLIGGATSKVGDPSGRLTSREAIDVKVQKRNFRRMWTQTIALWECADAYGKRHGFLKGQMGQRRILDNATWLEKLGVLDFLRVLGNGARVGTMLGRDTVRNKMEKGDGMSFAEFTYPLLQGWDWWHMYKTHGVQVQVGGADQYGNIVAGMDAVRVIAQSEGHGVLEKAERAKEPIGLTVPLLTTSSGEKFGKSAGNAIWLDLKMTSAFDLYGFLLKTADADVGRYLKLFTFIPVHKISEVMAEHSQDPGKRIAQHLLASEILELVHGAKEAEKTKAKHQAMRKPTLDSILNQDEPAEGAPKESGGPRTAKVSKDEDAEIHPIPEKTTSDDSAPLAPEDEPGQIEQHIPLPESRVLNLPFPTILHNARLASSKSEASRMIAGGGVYVARPAGDEGSRELKFVPVKEMVEKNVDVGGLLVDGRLVLRLGKWKVRVIRVLEDGVFDSPLLRTGWEGE